MSSGHKPVRILGIGSPSGDDQAGWLTVDALRGMGVSNISGIGLDKLDRPGVSLIARLEDADRVILIDAMQSGVEPGRIRHFSGQDWTGYSGGLSSHGLGVLDALALAQTMNSLPPRLDLYGIEIGTVLPGTQATAAIQSAARRLASLIAVEIGMFTPGYRI